MTERATPASLPALLPLRRPLPPANPPRLQKPQPEWRCVPAAAAALCALSFLPRRPDSLLPPRLRPRKKAGAATLCAAFLIAVAPLFSEVALAAPRLAAGSAGIGEPWRSSAVWGAPSVWGLAAAGAAGV